jgi:transposase
LPHTLSDAQRDQVRDLLDRTRQKEMTPKLSDSEKRRLRSVRVRCEIVLGYPVKSLKDLMFNRCRKQSVYNTLRAFARDGVAALEREPGRPKDPARTELIRDTLRKLHESKVCATPTAYVDTLNELIDVPISLAQCRRYLRDLGIRFRATPVRGPWS